MTKISEECFQHLVESMPQRIKAVLKAKGGPTRYYQSVPNKVASECVYIYISMLYLEVLLINLCCNILVIIYYITYNIVHI